MKNNLALSHNLIVVFILLLSKVSCSVPVTRPSPEYIKKSCQTTLYPNLCYRSLAKYAIKIKTSPRLLAYTALIITFNTTRSTSRILRKLSKNRALRPRETDAVLECVEEVSDSVYELHKSMKELNESGKVRGPEFELRMNDIQTWVSAALTNDDTCMDDFNTKRRVKRLVRRLIRRIVRLTSIALAFINNYAGD